MVADDRSSLPIPRTDPTADPMRKLSRWADHSEGEHARAQTGVLDLLPWTHRAVRDLRGWCARLPGRSRRTWSELKVWAKNSLPMQRMESPLQSREDSRSRSEGHNQRDRENASYQRRDLTLPIFNDLPVLASRLRRSKRHRHSPRLAPCFPRPRRRRSSYCHAAWQRYRCAPFPIHRTDAALQSIHRSCLRRP